jgi:hypothetical protein
MKLVKKSFKIGASAKKSLMFEGRKTKLLKSNNISGLFVNTYNLEGPYVKWYG